MNISNDSTKCQHCKCELINYRFKILPQKNVGKQMKKLVRKSETSTQRSYGKCQASLLKKYRMNNGNKLVITCLVCNQKNIKLLKKPDREKRPEVIAKDPNNESELGEDRIIKKKKKKDKLAGLKAFAVEEAILKFGKVERATESSEMMPKKTKKSSKNAAIATTDLEPGLSKIGSSLSTSIGLSNTDTGVYTDNSKHKNKNIDKMNKVTKLMKKQKQFGVKGSKDALVASAVVGKKFKNNSKLQGMLAMADAAKLTMKKKERKSNFLDSLKLLLE